MTNCSKKTKQKQKKLLYPYPCQHFKLFPLSLHLKYPSPFRLPNLVALSFKTWFSTHILHKAFPNESFLILKKFYSWLPNSYSFYVYVIQLLLFQEREFFFSLNFVEVLLTKTLLEDIMYNV